jgi:hypothetical protein
MTDRASRLIGTYDWVESGLTLSDAERRRLLGELVKVGIRCLGDLSKLRFGLIPKSVARVDFTKFDPPDSNLARRAEEAWSEQPNPEIRGHARRTCLFGTALAAVDECALDAEAFYCAALLHDYGLDRGPIQGVDFTLMGADRARVAIMDSHLPGEKTLRLRREVADAICIHATPGISVELDGSLGYYVMAGSMADATGLHRWSVGQEAIAEIYKRERCGNTFKRSLKHEVWREAHAVPKGRFALYACCGFTSLVQLAPLPKG